MAAHPRQKFAAEIRHLGIDVPMFTGESLDEIARATGRPVSSLVREAIDGWLASPAPAAYMETARAVLERHARR